MNDFDFILRMRNGNCLYVENFDFRPTSLPTQGDVLWWRGIKKNKSLTKKALMALRELLFRGNDMRHRSTVVDSRQRRRKSARKELYEKKKCACMETYSMVADFRSGSMERRDESDSRKLDESEKKRKNVFQEISASHSFLDWWWDGDEATGRVVWKSEWKNSSSSGTHRTQQSERILARSGEKTSVRMENWFCAQFSECGKEHSGKEQSRDRTQIRICESQRAARWWKWWWRWWRNESFFSHIYYIRPSNSFDPPNSRAQIGGIELFFGFFGFFTLKLFN